MQMTLTGFRSENQGEFFFLKYMAVIAQNQKRTVITNLQYLGHCFSPFMPSGTLGVIIQYLAAPKDACGVTQISWNSYENNFRL